MNAQAQVAERAANYGLFEFIKGQADCRDGVPHESGKSESYDAGYSTQYELEQIRSARHERIY